MFFRIFLGYLIVIVIFITGFFILLQESVKNYPNDIGTLIGEIEKNLINITISVIAISFLISLIFYRGLLNPIKKLNSAISRLASGDFNTKIYLNNSGELQRLARNFNNMAEQINILFNELSTQKEELNSIILSIQEGLLVLNNEGKIILSNKSFMDFMQKDSIEGRFYWEIIREQKFDELIKKVMNERKDLSSEIKINDRIFLCSANFLLSKEEIVLTLHDITDIKDLERIKRDFVANLSHELRTPLTSIKGFAETIEESIDENNKPYLEIIKRNTERLINIVRDLLLLSEMEKEGKLLDIERLDLKSLTVNVMKIFEQQAKDKNLDLKLITENESLIIEGDAFKIEQMLINLIENAIKYTEEGEVNVSLKQKSEHAIIEVQDTGIGIPESHIPRIFERFYVVDKSRSKKFGGTGLGLSIVKHIVMLHNGKIEVESIYGSGTKFTIILPINILA